MGGDVIDHGAGIFAAEDVFVAVFHEDEKAVGRFAVISHISADVTFSENAPVAHIKVPKSVAAGLSTAGYRRSVFL